MLTFSHRYNKFNLLIVIIGMAFTTTFIVKYFITNDDFFAGIAFLSFFATVIYAKMSNISGNI